ncbi:ankyrin repeat domain-containing protein [Burkholderia vietnamiensis]|uniref:Ankyrin n=1 Tax=Burkholderia vietnamiensis (strain G4 / LMG 22486) TaxID=269482 RepID=A4JFT9_BURVG|nr:Ankyrin [Burkholderia vietnamiensis G4]MCB4344899.1 ankyrin repeat domain-containing protein [Burkholderia vietnamiensis]
MQAETQTLSEPASIEENLLESLRARATLARTELIQEDSMHTRARAPEMSRSTPERDIESSVFAPNEWGDAYADVAPEWQLDEHVGAESGFDLADAIGDGRDREVLAALASGASPEGDETLAWAPLHTAAAMDNGVMCAALVDAGADIERPFNEENGQGFNDGWTALHWSAHEQAQGHATRALLARGANPLARSAAGDLPLHVAARQGSAQASEALLDALRAQERSWEAQSTLSSTDRRQAASPLTEALFARNALGQTPLELAAQNVFDAAPSVSSTDRNASLPSTSRGADAAWSVARQLVRSGADPAVRGAQGDTLLHLAIRRGDEELVDLVCAACVKKATTGDRVAALAPLVARDALGAAPLHLAVRRGQSAVSETLIAAVRAIAPDANAANDALNARNAEGETALHVAATGYASIHESAFADARRRVDLVDRLAAAGLDVNAQDAQGNTPLHRAAAQINLPACRSLLARNAEASLGIQNIFKETLINGPTSEVAGEMASNFLDDEANRRSIQ